MIHNPVIVEVVEVPFQTTKPLELELDQTIQQISAKFTQYCSYPAATIS